MKYGRSIFVINLLLWVVRCPPHRGKNESIRTLDRRTGEVIAVDNLIHQYEKEHQKLYSEETKNEGHLEWPTLDNKNLSNYCRKYLQHSVPTVKTENAIGNQIKVLLQYEKENTSMNSTVVTVHCKVKRPCPLSYYITRALEPNCVYSLKCSKPNKKKYRFTIICKHCDFEDKPFANSLLKRNREVITKKVHRTSGQPIANDEYLFKYELEHQEMLKKEEVDGKIIKWPHITIYPKLNHYCYQYIGECAPGRQRNGATGRLKHEKLHYEKLNTNNNDDIIVKTVICVPHNASRVQYYMTKAPEPNCVYALLRKGANQHYPLVIIFKHCNFKDDNNQPTNPKDYDTTDGNVIPKFEEGALYTMSPLQLLPTD